MKLPAAVVSLAMLASPAAAEFCAPYASLAQQMQDGYQEAPQMRLASEAGVFEVWVNTGTGTWTIIIVNSAGIACAKASGEGFSVLRDLSGIPS